MDINIELPDLGKLVLDVNCIRPSLIDAMIAEYDDMQLDTDDDDIITECHRVLTHLYEIRGALIGS